MLTREKIRQNATEAAYGKGREIYSNSYKILRMDIDHDKNGCDRISAVVKGSHGEKYAVFGVYDHEEDALEEMNCQCPAWRKYPGLCKHCVAVLLKYLDYGGARRAKKTEKQPYVPPVAPGMLRRARLSDYQENRRTTSGVIRDILDRETRRSVGEAEETEILGRVRLHPKLTLTENAQKAQFTIGIDHLYVLKDVWAFVENMEDSRLFAYGKKLQFVHRLDCFEPASRALVRFLQNWVQNRMQISSNAYPYAVALNRREISLSDNEFQQLMDILGNQDVEAQVTGYRCTKWQTASGEKKHGLAIAGVGNGVELRLQKGFIIKGQNTCFVFDEGKVIRMPATGLEEVQDLLLVFRRRPGEPLFVHRDDLPVFCRELLPQLRRLFDCREENFRAEDFVFHPDGYRIYIDLEQEDMVVCRCTVLYGEKEYDLAEQNRDMQKRDRIEENCLLGKVSTFFDGFDQGNRCFFLQADDDKLYALLTAGLEQLQEMGEVYISERLKRIRVKPLPQISAGLSLSGDLLQLTVEAEGMRREELAEILSRYEQKKKYFRLKNGDFIQQDEGLAALAEIMERLALSAEELTAQNLALPKFRALYLDSLLREDAAVYVERERSFKSLIREMKNVEDNDYEVPQSLRPILRGYQEKGFLWLKTLNACGFSGVLADDMGLGKTLQVIAFLLSSYQEGVYGRPSLIVCPASLVYNWESEIRRFAPQLTTRLIAGTAGERAEQIAAIAGSDVCITSYELLRRDIEHYEGVSFSCQVIDEAQHIKNHMTKAAKAVKSIDSGFRLALTGTPVENRLSELWSIFDYLMPGLLFSYKRFRREVEAPVINKKDESAMAELKKIITPFILRRLKKDVLRDLPDKIEENLVIVMEDEQKDIYDANVVQLKRFLDGQSEQDLKTSKIQILAGLTRLRQICCDPTLLYENYKGGSSKVESCMDLVENGVDGGHKILIFSQFTSMLDILAERLRESKIPFYMLTGATDKEERLRLTEAFNRDQVPVFLISLKAGGTGLNLTAADVVIHFDPWWNLAVQNQATDRAHRIGQKRVVNVYKLIAKNSIEENIVKLQERKKDLAEQLLSGSGMSSIRLNREELMELLADR